jgi:hypothetical protein
LLASAPGKAAAKPSIPFLSKLRLSPAR